MKKEGLGKMVIRIVVAGLILALIVLILMVTVFKVSSSQRAYNSLNDAFSPSGTITSMTEELNDFQEFDAEYGDYIVVFKSELVTLQSCYTKLYFVGKIDDAQIDGISNQLDEMKKSLEEATKLIKDVNEGKRVNTELNVETYVQSLKPKIVNALAKVLAINCSLQEFLTTNYYNGEYYEQPFLNKLKSFIAKQYYIVADKDYGGELAQELFNFYNYLATIGFDNSDITKTSELNSVLKVLKDVNLFKMVDNITAYKNDYVKDTAKTAMIEQVENYINSISANFQLIDIANAKGAA